MYTTTVVLSSSFWLFCIGILACRALVCLTLTSLILCHVSGIIDADCCGAACAATATKISAAPNASVAPETHTGSVLSKRCAGIF